MGHTLSLLSKAVHGVGVDFSQQALKIASQKVNCPFICADAQALPFQDDRFHYVVVKDLLEHVPDDRQVIKEIFRVCQPGGRVFLYLPCALSGVNFSTESLVKKLTGYTIDPDVGHLRRYTTKRAKQMLQAQGFKPIKTRYFVHFSLGVVSLLSVKGYKVLSRGKQEGEAAISGTPLTFLQLVFKLFEILGRIEALLLGRLPGAGFFIEAVVEKGAPRRRISMAT